MERLTGIGVSPGIAVGRAVVLTERTEVVRFPIPPERVAEEVAALEQARQRSHTQLTEIRDRLAGGAGHDLAPLFDAQLLILDDSMFLGRARALIETERVNAAWAVHRAYEELCAVFATRRGSLPARTRQRRRRRRRPGAHEPAAARAARRTSDPLRDVDGPAVLDRRRAHRLAGGAARLVAGARLRHRRRRPHAPHRDPGPLAEGAGGRRPARRQPARAPGHAGDHRRHRRRRRPVDPSPDDIAARAAAAPAAAASPAPAPRRGRSARPSTADGVAIRLDANLERLDDVPARARRRRRRHRPVPLGVPARRPRRPTACPRTSRSTIYRDLLAARGAAAGHRAHLRPRRAAAGRVGRARAARRPPGPARPAPRPGPAARCCARSCGRCCARRRPARCAIMFPFVTSVEEMRRARALMRRARRRGRRRARCRSGRWSRCRRRRWPPTCWPARPRSSPSAPTT